MQYAILVYQSDDAFAAAKKPDPGLHQAFLAYAEAMKKAGVYVFGAGLQAPETATTLKFQGDKPVVQDGPYADTKEQLGGLGIIDVPDLDSALEWAARMPRVPGRVYEIRPVPSYND